jgi:hypothetical protein
MTSLLATHLNIAEQDAATSVPEVHSCCSPVGKSTHSAPCGNNSCCSPVGKGTH